jgi:hypothetical protein
MTHIEEGVRGSETQSKKREKMNPGRVLPWLERELDAPLPY